MLLASITDYLDVYESPEMQLNATRLNQAGKMLPMFRSRPMTVQCRGAECVSHLSSSGTAYITITSHEIADREINFNAVSVSLRSLHFHRTIMQFYETASTVDYYTLRSLFWVHVSCELSHAGNEMVLAFSVFEIRC